MKKQLIDFESIQAHVLKRLENELSPDLHYHGIHHTRDDVLPAAERLGKLMGLDEEQLFLVKIAALYHDLGYVETRVNHELVSARLAKEALLQRGMPPQKVELITGMIMATRLPQTPHNVMEQILCDADMDSLGREDFFIISHNLRLELRSLGMMTSVREWYVGQIKFLEEHQYFTDAAKKLRNAGKLANIRELNEVLNGS